VKISRRYTCELGAANLSAGWSAQGHTVILKSSFLIYVTNSSKCQSEQFPLLPSSNLRTQLYLGTPKWLDISRDIEVFINLTLSLINPDLFKSGLSMLRKLCKMEGTNEVAEKWQSVYAGVAVISNRRMPSHRYSKGRP
jgi:hypothetical protein